MDITKDYYKILGVSPSVEPEALQAVYRALAKKYHPDTTSHTTTSKIFRDIQEAYDNLSDPKLREIYDREKIDDSISEKEANEPKDFRDTSSEITKNAVEVFEFVSTGLKNIVSEIRENRHASILAKITPVANETQSLMKLLGDYLEWWGLVSEEGRQQVLHELNQLADDFMLNAGEWGSDKVVSEFLYMTRTPEPSSNQQGAIKYLQLIESAHNLFSKMRVLPKKIRPKFEHELVSTMFEFQSNTHPLILPHPFSQRWIWSSFKS